MARFHHTNISPAQATLIIGVQEGGTLLITDWEVNQKEYDLTEVVFTHELNGRMFSYCKENACLVDESGEESETFEIWLPNWSGDGKPLTARAWVE